MVLKGQEEKIVPCFLPYFSREAILSELLEF